MSEGVWTWRQKVKESKLPPLAKLVCYNLSLYMNDLGKGCFPSIGVQVDDTGLARSTVLAHLKIAREMGYVVIERERHGGKWGHNRYRPAWPKGSKLASGAATCLGPCDGPSDGVLGPPDEYDGPGDGPRVVRETDPNSPIKSPYNSPLRDEGTFHGPATTPALSDSISKNESHSPLALGKIPFAEIRGTSLVPGIYR